MKKKKEVDLRPVSTDLQLFQEQYGQDWERMLGTPVFRAGMQLLNMRALDQITALSDEQVEKYSLGILSQLIGQLKHENQMFNLHKEKEFRFPLEEDEQYLAPEQVEALEKQMAQFREQTRKERYG